VWREREESSEHKGYRESRNLKSTHVFFGEASGNPVACPPLPTVLDTNCVDVRVRGPPVVEDRVGGNVVAEVELVEVDEVIDDVVDEVVDEDEVAEDVSEDVELVVLLDELDSVVLEEVGVGVVDEDVGVLEELIAVVEDVADVLRG